MEAFAQYILQMQAIRVKIVKKEKKEYDAAETAWANIHMC